VVWSSIAKSRSLTNLKSINQIETDEKKEIVEGQGLLSGLQRFNG